MLGPSALSKLTTYIVVGLFHAGLKTFVKRDTTSLVSGAETTLVKSTLVTH